MDKKNTFLGVIFIAAGIGFMFWQTQQLEEQRREQLRQEQELSPPVAQSTTPLDAVLEGQEGAAAASANDAPSGMLELLAQDVEVGVVDSQKLREAVDAEEETILLSNDFIEVEFTTRGGAIRQVKFLQTKRGELDDYIFNEDGYLPALSLSLLTPSGQTQEFDLNYTVARKAEDSITFALDAGNGLIIERSYSLAEPGAEADPYIIQHSTKFVNRDTTPKVLSSIFLNLGTARPLTKSSQVNYLNVGYFNGEKAKFDAINKLTGSGGFLGIGSSAPRDSLEREGQFEWSSVKNQFFASVLSSERVASGVLVYPVEALGDEVGALDRPGITGSAKYDVGTVQPGAEESLEFDFYVGPKEFKRLKDLGNAQDLVMQFGFFGFFSKLLLAFMYLIHSVVPSWGWSIVLMTICIKLLFWPLTAKASRSQKRMATIQEPMAALKEKYKDNPQKMQQETLNLFKKHKINPLAGCLPILVQMPVFLGLFYMLRTASELRFEPFLWVADLSQPDTVLEIGGFPLNLLPLIMGVTMFLQMHMMPTSPTMDPMQQKIFKFMPLIFLVFLYNFSSGLVLYWTIQNILTIIQQKITNSRPDPEPVGATSSGGASRSSSNRKSKGRSSGKSQKK